MMNHSANTCPHCGKPIRDRKPETEEPTAENSAAGKDEAREYDHRGIAMPRRTRMGGIITPQ